MKLAAFALTFMFLTPVITYCQCKGLPFAALKSAWLSKVREKVLLELEFVKVDSLSKKFESEYERCPIMPCFRGVTSSITSNETFLFDHKGDGYYWTHDSIPMVSTIAFLESSTKHYGSISRGEYRFDYYFDGQYYYEIGKVRDLCSNLAAAKMYRLHFSFRKLRK